MSVRLVAHEAARERFENSVVGATTRAVPAGKLLTMSGHVTKHRRPMLFLAATVLALSACGTTVNDDPNVLDEADLTGGEGREIAEENVTPLDQETIVDSDAPATTVAMEGTAGELLPEIGVDMSRLSSEIAAEGNEDATIARIEAAWEAIRDQIESEAPELLNGIQATIDMARTAVDANRPADADKAFSLLTDLIDKFTGDR